MTITVYTTATCGYCHAVKGWLRQKGITYIERRVDLNPIAAQYMVQLSGQMGVPFTTVEREGEKDMEMIVGFNPQRFEQIFQEEEK